MAFAFLQSFLSWALPLTITLLGGLLALLRYLTDRQEKNARTLQREIEALRGEMHEGDELNRKTIEDCKSQQTQSTASFRLMIAEQREKAAGQRLDDSERMLNKNDFRDFTNRLEERLGRMETKIDHLGSTAAHI